MATIAVPAEAAGARAGSEGAVELPAVVDNRASRRASNADSADLARLPTPP